LDVIGFAVYSYEGVGVVLPIMEITEKPEHYKKVLVAVMLTVLISYVGFGELTYMVYGNNVQDIIISNLPTDTTFNLAFVSSLIVFFCINLVFTYPLVIYPANIILESYMFGHMKKSKKKMWLINLYRAGMVLFTVVISLSMGDSLDKFLSLLGAVACTPIAFTLPTLFHYKLCAKTKMEKGIDIFIIVISLIILVFCSGFVLATWNSS
jgi:proton-coupled amino acid transporter